MTLARHVVFFICLAVVVPVALISGWENADDPDEFGEILFCATCFLSCVGIAGFVIQFAARRIGSIFAYLFFGFFAGLMGTNLLSGILDGVIYDSFTEYLTSYGMMLFLLAFSITGIVLVQITDQRTIARHTTKNKP